MYSGNVCLLAGKLLALKLTKNRARGNRKSLKRPKMMSKINFRNLKLKSHEEYLIGRTEYRFCFEKDLIFKLKRKVEKGERNDEMTRQSKSKAFLKCDILDDLQTLCSTRIFMA